MEHLFFQISWIRRRDWHILSAGKATYTTDERFQVLHTDGSDEWTLQIKYIQKRDAGKYLQTLQEILMMTFSLISFRNIRVPGK